MVNTAPRDFIQISANPDQYCHLLEARLAIDKPGIYESVNGRHGTSKEMSDLIRSAMAHDFDLLNCSYYYDALKKFDSVDFESGSSLWAARLLDGGIPAEEVNFVFTVLNPDPMERWTAEEIIRSGFLDALQGLNEYSDQEN